MIKEKYSKNEITLIDLGLPSGTLWADRNVGADKPEGYGDYFRFGETVPFTENSTTYNLENIKKGIAGTDKDAATTILGVQYRMPTFEQIEELVKFCSWKWTQINGVNGTMLIGPNGNSIFFPASGLRDYCYGSLHGVGSYVCNWSGSLESGINCYLLYFHSSYCGLDDNFCALGCPVRAVNG